MVILVINVLIIQLPLYCDVDDVASHLHKLLKV